MLPSARCGCVSAWIERAAQPPTAESRNASEIAVRLRLRMRAIAAGNHGIAPAPGDQRAGVRERDRPFPRRLVGEVAGHPLRVELLLVGADALEVVPLLTAPEDQRGHALAAMRTRLVAHRRQRRHPEVERAESFLLAVQHDG